MSNAAIYIRNPKKAPALAGSLIVNRGIRTIICYVFIIPNSYYKLADIMIFSAILPATTTLVA